MRFQGQLALVVGASGGIGDAIARHLVSEGSDAVLTYQRDRQALDPIVELAAAQGRRCQALQLDLLDPAAVGAVCQQVIDQAGCPTLVVYSAGVMHDRPLAQMQPGEWEAVIAVNLTGAYRVLHQLTPAMMRQRKPGRILLVSSVSGLFGQPGQTNYSASKAGLIGLTRSLARELGPFDITVNALAPGLVETPLTEPLSAELKRHYLRRIPMRRFATPADVVPAAALLLAPEAAYITGQVLVVDGGLSC